TRTADYMLASAISTRGEKVGGVRVTNCHTDDPAAATTLIEATQAANTRSKTDKTYHLVFSFPPGEEPPLEILHKIEDELVRSIGYAEHQRISAVHIDTDHLHVHVAINKVHPKGYQNIEPYFDKKKLMEACDRLELEYGLTRTNHGLTGQEPKSKMKEKQAQVEAHTGIESLQGHISREIAPKLKEAKTWQEAHSILAKHGLQIKKRGAGLVIGSGDLWVKASQCDRALSLKALSDRLGPMEQGPKPVKAYEPKPKQGHPSSAALYEQYQNARNSNQQKREHGLEQIKYQGDLLEYNLKKWNRAQRLIVKAGFKGPQKLLMLKTVKLQTQLKRNKNHKKIDAKRKEFLSGSSFPSWSNWLAQSAINGNEEALAVLRSRQEREQMAGNCLSAPAKPAHFVVPNLRPTIDKNGHVFYQTYDGGLVIDRSNHVQCFRTTAGAAQFALELAAKRFNGQALVVEGSEEFKKEV
ncbi:MAG TPA: TraI/MobA(P) family conjugative relaxase, partial [Nitrosospira sp.]|nr:TraI/MobA(P) family conjugative relaxase [Nitrosospira sp.]